MERWATRVVGLWMLCLFLPVVGWAGEPIDWSEQPQCLATWVAAGQRTVTPAEVTGKPREHLTLRGHNPYDIRPYEQSRPDRGYLITGNKVDVVTACNGFDFVRFHGPMRISTGWADETRIKVTGPVRGTLPPDAPMLCKAAESTLNGGKQLDSLSSTLLDSKVLDHLLGQYAVNSSARVGHIVVDGRKLAVLLIDGGLVYVYSNNLKTELSPADREDRDVENNGADTWASGVAEDVVIVHGQPMVRSWGPDGDPSSSFHLSIIDSDGDFVPTCSAEPESLEKREIATTADAAVCRAILAGQQISVPMHTPSPSDSLVLGNVPKQYVKGDMIGKRNGTAATELYYFDKSVDAQVEYVLFSTGRADLGNSGQSRHVGLVSFTKRGLAAGYHPYWNSQIFPVYFDTSGVADLSSDANQKLANSLPHGMGDGKLVTLDGATYLELSPQMEEPSSEVWKINASGANQICRFKLTREVVRPLTD